MKFISKHHDKSNFELKFIQLITIPNLFPLEIYKNVNIANYVYYGKTRL